MLNEISNIAIVRVFMVEDHGDVLVGMGYDFGHIYSSGMACPLLVFFNRLLGVSHLRVSYSRVVFWSISLPLDEVVDDFLRFLSPLSAYHARMGVKDFFNFVLLFAVN